MCVHVHTSRVGCWVKVGVPSCVLLQPVANRPCNRMHFMCRRGHLFVCLPQLDQAAGTWMLSMANSWDPGV